MSGPAQQLGLARAELGFTETSTKSPKNELNRALRSGRRDGDAPRAPPVLPVPPPPRTCLPLILPGELGLELLLALLTVSMRADLLCACLPADESGLLTAPRTLAVLG